MNENWLGGIKMKKLLCCVFTLLLVVGLFSGLAACAENTLTPVTVSLQLHPEDLYEKGVQMFGDIAKELGIEITLNAFSSEVAEEKINTMIASGDMADIFWATKGTFNLYGEELFTPIGSLLEHMPNFKALMDADDSIKANSASDGELYYVPKYAELYKAAQGSISYRKDVLDEMGLTEPTTMEGWYETFKAVKEAYPDMTIIMIFGPNGATTFLPQCFGICNLGNNCGVVSGKMDEIVYLPTSENYKAMLQWVNRLYEEGLLYQGYQSADYTMWWDQGLCTDKCFATYQQNFNRCYEATLYARQNGYENVQWWVATQPENPLTGKNEILLSTSAWMDFGFGISNKSEVKAEAAKLIDWFFGQECTDLQIVQLEDPDYPELPFFFWPINMINYFESSDEPVMKDHFAKNNPLVVYAPVLSATAEGMQTITDATEGLSDYVAEMREGFITGDVSFDEWDTYVEECKNLGCDTALEVVTGYYETYRALAD
jgi:putative aldouronate transport system substrate-binding protein